MAETYTATEAARLLGVSDKTIRAWLKAGRFPGARIAKIKGLRQWVIPEGEIKAVQAQESAETTGGISEIWAELEAMRASIAEIKRDIEALRSSGSHERAGAYRHVPETKLHKELPDLHKTTAPAPIGGIVPPGYISLAQFAHGIPETTQRRYVETGAVTSGRWQDGAGHVIKHILNAEQQTAYYQHFCNHPRFVACSNCPHDGGQGAKKDPQV